MRTNKVEKWFAQRVTEPKCVCGEYLLNPFVGISIIYKSISRAKTKRNDVVYAALDECVCVCVHVSMNTK